MFKPQQIICALFAYCLLIAVYKVDIASAATFCPDPLNIQTSRSDTPATPASASSDGVVTCGTSPSACGIIMATGAGVCLTTGTATSSTILLTAATGQTTSNSFANTYTNTNGAITSCWNPATGAAAVLSPATLSATNTILACYTSSTYTGRAIQVVTGTTTNPTPSTPLSTAGAYCFSTNCNIGRYVPSAGVKSTINLSIVTLIFSSVLTMQLF